MTKDAARIVLLTGAPLSRSLDWSDNSLCCPLQECFVEHGEANVVRNPSPSALPAWRNLPLDVKHLPSGLTQLNQSGRQADGDTQEANEETSFLTVTDISMISDGSNEDLSQEFHSPGSSHDDIVTQFYEHSYAVHEELPSSNVFDLDSLLNTSTLPDSIVEGEKRMIPKTKDALQIITRPKPRSPNATSLRNIPNAFEIQKQGLSTMSVDLIIGILSISSPRTIRTKKYGRLVELVEMMVADETRSGFSITIWLPTLKEKATKNGPEANLRSTIASLRPQDIILAKNVALDSFKGKVYGQSLRNGITKLDLLYRNMVDSHDEPGAYSWDELNSDMADSQLGKIRTVHEWMMSFVGANRGHRIYDGEGKDRLRKRRQPQLPADTQ